MPYRANYPASVQEVLRPRRKYRPAVLRAVKAFARSKPWQGRLSERREKFRAVHLALCQEYGLAVPLVFSNFEGFSGGSCYVPATRTILLAGRLSVVTYLHEFGHALGKDERQTCIWSINLFRRCFPRSYGRCRHRGHVLEAPPR
jgi:hypothetical protein